MTTRLTTTMATTMATHLIRLSRTEDRAVTACPDTAEEAAALLDALAAQCSDDCAPYEYDAHRYDVWGDDWRIAIVCQEVR